MSNANLVERGKKVLMNTYARAEFALVKGDGCTVYDKDGNSYLDFLAGIAVSSLGHNHPKITKAIESQAHQLLHCSNLYWIEPQIETAEILCEKSFADKVFFCNSGAEANEGAIKLARKYAQTKGYSERYEIITMNKSFHGRTLATLTATGQEKFHKDFKPLMPGFVYSDYNDIEMLKSKISEKTCAIMIEIIQGEGGVNMIDKAFVEELDAICKEKDILLVIDEVQTGIGRTGKLFAYQHFNINPDIITLAKGLGGGVPIGAFLAKDSVALALSPGDHGSTFGGNPLATASAKAVLGVVGDNNFLSKVNQKSDLLVNGLKKLAEKNENIVAVRGKGLLIGLELNAPVAGAVKKCLENGLIVGTAGPNVIRLAPPLVVSEADINKAIEILSEAIK